MNAAADPASLDRLHDLVVPAPVPWWPPAPGWYVVAGFVLLLLGWFVWRALRRWRRDAYRRAALVELSRLSERIKHPGEREAALRSLPELVKRTALAAWPRAEIASLSGESWTGFLDATGGTQAFGTGPGRLLPQLAYAGEDVLEDVSDEELAALFQTLREWVRGHRPLADR